MATGVAGSSLGLGAGSVLAEALPVAGVAAKTRQRFLYEQGPLVMTADALRDANGKFLLAQLPTPTPKCKVTLKGDVTPLTERMWKIALDDVERNQVKHESGVVYFGAGTRYGDRVYTRDISIAGVLGVNRFYPNEMLSSLKLTREIRRGLGYKVSAPHKVSEIDVPWEVIAQVDKEVMAKYKTNSYTRATDDVVWLWAADDLFTLHPELADWKWLLENGEHFFKVFYAPWFDPSDGLYRGQPLYHDITNSAYPKGMEIADCVLLKALSTNCLYYRGLLAMANACEKGGRPAAGKQQWLDRAAALKAAIVKVFTKPDGTLAYYKDRHGKIMSNREILGTAFAAIFGILEGDAAKAAGPDGLWPDGNWRAGIILRGNTNTTIGEPLGSQSRGRFAALFSTVNNGTYFQDDTMRAGNGDANRWSANLGGSYRWFKLQRLGDSFISSVSPDGVGWTVVNSTNLPNIGAKIYAGLFTHAEQSMNPNIHSASFDNFSLTGTNVLGPASVSISPLTSTAIGGQSATFTAFIIGSASAGFQWQLNGTNLVGATNATLTIPSVTAADLGNYTVIANSVTSAPAVLTMAATVNWNGGGTNANWTTAANWTGSLPADGDLLVFQGTQRQNNTNNLLSSAGRIVFSNGGFTLRGNPLMLQGGLVNVSGNNTHNIATTLTAPQSFVSSNGTLTVSAGVANGGFNLTFDGAGSNVVNWPITGSGAVIKTGAGSATLSPAHYYTGGTIVNAGTFYLAYNNSVSGAGTLQGTLTVNSNALAVCSVNNALGWTGPNWVRNITLNYGTLRTDVATDNGWGTTINMIGGNLTAGVANGYFAMGNSPVFNVTGTNVPSVISANLTVRDAAPGGIVFNVTRGAAATDLNISGKLLYASTGGITLNGGGIVQLTGATTYTGPTLVNACTLLVNSPGSLGPFSAGTLVTVASGATLGGTGTVNGAVTNSGTLSPGNNGVGTFTTGGETWNGGANLLCEINATNATGADLVAITGSLNLQSSAGSPFTIRLASLTPGGDSGPVTNFNKFTSYGWTIATTSAGVLNFATNKFTFDTSAFGNDFSGGTWSVATNGNSLVLQFSAASPSLVEPTFTGFGPWSNDSFPLSFSAPSGQSYKLLTSTNLTLPLLQWTTLVTGIFGISPVTYIIANATNDCSFYRVKSP